VHPFPFTGRRPSACISHLTLLVLRGAHMTDAGVGVGVGMGMGMGMA